MTFGWSGINAFRMLGRGPMVRRFLDSARESGLEVSAGLTNSRADLAWATAMGIDMVWVDPHALDLARAHQMNASAA